MTTRVAVAQLDRIMGRLLTRVARLMARVDGIDTRLERVEKAVAGLDQPAPRRTYAFKVGDRVTYWPGRRALWVGTVIPRPHGFPVHGLQRDRGNFVYVLRDSDKQVRGCYGDNLARLS